MEPIVLEEDAYSEEASEGRDDTQTSRLINLTASFQSLFVEHTVAVPEYPSTHKEGYAYCIDVRGICDIPRTLGEGRSVPHSIQGNVQYSTYRTHGPFTTTCTYLGAKCLCLVNRCSGMKHCEYIQPDIRTHSHTEASPEEWQFLSSTRPPWFDATDDRKRRSIMLYRTTMAQWRRKAACKPSQRNTCALEFVQGSNLTGPSDAYIQCSNFHREDNHFHFHRFLPSTDYDIECLRDLIHNPQPQPTQTCSIYENMWIDKPKCGIDHPQGEGSMKHQPCDVQFIWLVPYDLDASPYVILCCVGEHNHPLIPPSQLPYDVAAQLWELIKRSRDRQLPTAKFHAHPLFQQWKELGGATNFEEVYKALNTTERIPAMIQKMRAFWWPGNRDINAVIFAFEKEQHQPENGYIQDISQFGDNNWIVTCFSREQAHLWAALGTFEVDMTHNRVRDQEINEVLITVQGEHNQVLTLCRVYTTWHGDQMWRQLFHCAMRSLARILGLHQIQWGHLESQPRGFYCVKMDQSEEQYSGLGQYLQDIDPLHRPSNWQLQHVLMLAGVPFFQRILEITGDHVRMAHVQSMMMSLPHEPSYEEYVAVLEVIENHSNPDIQRWATNKKNPVVASGICMACSKLPPKVWAQELPHPILDEGSGWKNQSLGKALDLARAVEIGRRLDQRDLDQWDGWTKFGVWIGQKGDSLPEREQRTLSHEQQEKITRLKQRRGRRKQRNNEHIDYDSSDAESDSQVYLDIQSPGSSRRPSSSRRSRPIKSNRGRTSTARRDIQVEGQPHALSPALAPPRSLSEKSADMLSQAEFEYQKKLLQLELKEIKLRQMELDLEMQEAELARRRLKLQEEME